MGCNYFPCLRYMLLAPNSTKYRRPIRSSHWGQILDNIDSGNSLVAPSHYLNPYWFTIVAVHGQCSSINSIRYVGPTSHSVMSHDDVIKWKVFPRYGTFCVGNSPATGEFPPQRPVTWSFDVFFDLRLNKRLSKQSRRRWFETHSRSLFTIMCWTLHVVCK